MRYFDAILADALRLSPADRADLAAQLLVSLDGPVEHGVEAAWANRDRAPRAGDRRRDGGVHPVGGGSPATSRPAERRDMIQLQLHRAGDSFGVALPPLALAALGLTGREGERLALISLSEGGLEPRRNENDAERKHHLLLDSMRCYGHALRRLAT